MKSEKILTIILSVDLDELKRLNQKVKQSESILSDVDRVFLLEKCKEKIASPSCTDAVKEQLSHLSIHLIHQYQKSNSSDLRVARNAVLENRLAYLHATDFHDTQLTDSLKAILTDEKSTTVKVSHHCFFNKKVCKNEERVKVLENLITLSAQKDKATLRCV